MKMAVFPLRRFSLFALVLLSLAFSGRPVCAQSSSGPVHLPDATNAPAATPAPHPAAQPAWLAPSGAPGNSPAPVAPAVPSTVTAPPVAGDIHDIRGPISIPYQWFWVVVAVAVLAAAAALYLLWRFLPRRAAVRVKLPYEIALERLEAARALMTPDTVREYAFTVSEIIRVYIEQRFGEVAARRTTEEFLNDLISHAWSPLAVHRGRLEDFLGHCDLIKFARWGASARELELMHESARVFIVETHPRTETPEPPPGAPQGQLVSAK